MTDLIIIRRKNIVLERSMIYIIYYVYFTCDHESILHTVSSHFALRENYAHGSLFIDNLASIYGTFYYVLLQNSYTRLFVHTEQAQILYIDEQT